MVELNSNTIIAIQLTYFWEVNKRVKLLNYIFMVLILGYSIIRIFNKNSQKEKDDLNPDSILAIYRYFSLAAFNFFFVWYIFSIDTFLWLALFSTIGIILCLKSEKSKHEILIRFIIICVLIIGSAILRVPKHNDSFLDYISSKEKYQCHFDFECVKITEYVNKDDEIHTKAEIVPVKDYSFHWYFLYATGSIIFETNNGKKEEIRGVNIAGWWLLTDR